MRAMRAAILLMLVAWPAAAQIRLGHERVVHVAANVDAMHPVIATNGSDFLLAWVEVRPAGRTRISIAALDGRRGDPRGPRRAIERWPYPVSSVAVASDGSTFLLSWTEVVDRDWIVRALPLAADGTPLSDSPWTLGRGAGKVYWTGTNWLAWLGGQFALYDRAGQLLEYRSDPLAQNLRSVQFEFLVDAKLVALVRASVPWHCLTGICAYGQIVAEPFSTIDRIGTATVDLSEWRIFGVLGPEPPAPRLAIGRQVAVVWGTRSYWRLSKSGQLLEEKRAPSNWPDEDDWLLLIRKLVAQHDRFIAFWLPWMEDRIFVPSLRLGELYAGMIDDSGNAGGRMTLATGIQSFDLSKLDDDRIALALVSQKPDRALQLSVRFVERMRGRPASR